jgi:hypothetical protein
MATVAIEFITAWTFGIAMMFCMEDFEVISGTDTGVPILQLFF